MPPATTEPLSFWQQFFTSAGFGGSMAVLAAVLTGAVALLISKHRSASEALDREEQRRRRQSDEVRHTAELADNRSRLRAELEAGRVQLVADEQHRARSRWWEQFVWVTSEELTTRLETRLELLAVLTTQAEETFPDLVKVAKAYSLELYRQIG